MKKLLFFLVLSAFLFKVQGQDFRPSDLPLMGIPQTVMPFQDNKALRSAELAQRVKGRPDIFAVPMQVSISPATHGKWEVLPDGSHLWRHIVASPGAKSLNLGFSNYKMPPGGYMLLYTPDRSLVQGPFSLADNEDHAQLWTPILTGDQIVIEVVLPAGLRPALGLQLSSVNHDFMGWGSRVASGSCNLDVICGAADGWGIVDPHRDIIQSAGVYSLNGFQACSGALINNARNDCTPYFLTAEHCGVSSGNAASMVVYWNYENDPCRQPNSGASGQPGNGQLNQFNSGAILRSDYAPTDFSLVELDDPLDGAHRPYLAGWSRERALPTNTICVHHPGTEEKRISFDNDPAAVDAPGAGNDTTHLEVLDWDVGTTEGGSSGSPLFDQNERIVGQLTGGGAACGNNLSDIYGWVYSSWTGGGSSSSRLSDWLDPDNTGLLFMDGKNCAITISPVLAAAQVCNTSVNDTVFPIVVNDGFASPVTLTASNVPAGASSSFSMNPVAPGDTALLTIGNLSAVAMGVFDIEISGTDGTNLDSTSVQLTIVDALPTMLTLNQPSNGATNVSTFPPYAWSVSLGATYEIEVATDNQFNNIVDSGTGLTAPSFAGTGLQPLTTYYWRTRPENPCGAGPWSSTFSFETASITCSNLQSTDVPVNIAGTIPNTITSTINISSGGSITDVNVIDVQGSHSWLSDLRFTLTSPAGTVVDLIANSCGDNDDFFISWDDAATGTPPCPYTDMNTYPPIGSLADFNGENPNGTWTLTIEDSEFGDGGSLDGWGLEICGAGFTTSIASEVADLGMNLYPNPSSGKVTLQLTAPLLEEASVELLDLQGRRMRQFVLPAGTQQLPLGVEGLASGVYFVRMNASGHTLSQRLMLTQP